MRPGSVQIPPSIDKKIPIAGRISYRFRLEHRSLSSFERRAMPNRRSLAVLVAVLAAALLGPSAAQSATYTQHACRLPDGTAAPADGFSGYAYDPSGIHGNTCLGSGSLWASVVGT